VIGFVVFLAGMKLLFWNEVGTLYLSVEFDVLIVADMKMAVFWVLVEVYLCQSLWHYSPYDSHLLCTCPFVSNGKGLGYYIQKNTVYYMLFIYLCMFRGKQYKLLIHWRKL
jgi:hypothetical protein